MADNDLQQRLEKLGRSILKDVEDWELATRDRRRQALERLSRAFDKEERWQRKRERKLERRRRRQEERLARAQQKASLPNGLVFLAAALVCAGFAITRPGLWWMIFVAFGLGSAGAQQLHLASQQRRLERGQRAGQGEEEPEARREAPQGRHEVDVLCDQLLADLAQSPEAVRSFLKKPEQTVESLRRTCRALDERRQQLLAERPAERLEALQAQRAELLRKREAASDAEARRKLEQALRSLEGQASALERLRQSTERVDGEYTSLLVLLQELRTRVSVARTAGGSTQLEGLRDSVQRLNTELEAITDALESVQREGLSPVSEISEEDSGPRPQRGRERA
jgi:hypothetical protein